MLKSPRILLATAAGLVVGLVIALVWWFGLRDESYADRDWSALDAPPAEVPDVRAPDATSTRASLAALDACAVGAAGDPDARRRPGASGSCTVQRLDGTVVVHTAVTYFVDESRGLDAVNALNSRDRVEMAGVPVWVGSGPIGDPATEGTRACAVVVPASLEVALAIVGDSADCTTVTRIAEAALADILADISAPAGAAPLFYSVDEPDPGGEGGCAALADQVAWLCAPASTREVPEDPVEVIRQGEVDPDVLCTAALASATSTGRTMIAVTTAPHLVDLAELSAYDGPRTCRLLEPTEGSDDRDSVTITVTASRDPLETNGNATIAGHPAYHSGLAGSWDVVLTETTEPGHISIQVTESDTGGGRAVPKWAEDYVTELVERLLG